MGHLGVVLYEYLGEEYPEVLGSILGALKAIVNVIGQSCFRTFHVFVLVVYCDGWFPCVVQLIELV